MSACQGCGAPIPPSRGGRPRQWCSERCRRGQYAGACVDCGAPTNGHAGPGKASERCVACSSVRTAEMGRARWLEHRVMVEAMWADGKTSREIAAQVGIEGDRQRQQYIAKCRAAGYDLPHRYSAERTARMTAGAGERMAKARAVVATNRKAAA